MSEVDGLPPTPDDFYAADRQKAEESRAAELYSELEGLQESEPPVAEEENSPIMDKALAAVDYALSPFSAISDAVLAPIAYDNYKGNFIDQAVTAGGIAKDAFLGRLFPKFGEEHPDVAAKAAENILPDGTPETIRGIVARGAEFMLDPVAMASAPKLLNQISRKGIHELAKNPDATGTVLEAGIDRIARQRGLKLEEPIKEVKALASRYANGYNEALPELIQKLELSDLGPLVKESIKHDTKENFAALERQFPSEELLTTSYPQKAKVLRPTLTDNTPVRGLRINPLKINSDEDIKELVGNLETSYGAEYSQAIKGMKHRDDIAGSQSHMLAQTLGNAVVEPDPKVAYIKRQLLIDSASSIKAAAEQTDSPLAMVNFIKAVKVHDAIRDYVKGSTLTMTEVLKHIDATKLHNIGNVNTKEGQLVADMVKGMEPEEVANFLKETPFQKTSDVLYEFYINAILSGPITQTTNLVSNVSTTLMRPAEHLLRSMAATSRLDFREAGNELSDFKQDLVGIGQGVRDIVHIIAKNGVKPPDYPDVLMKNHELYIHEIKPTITSEKLQVQGPLGRFIDKAGSIIRLPGTSLLKADKGFKLMHYRMGIAEEATRKASRMGRSPEEFQRFRAALMQNPSRDILAESMEMGKLYTFTNDLGKTGKAFKHIVKVTPGLRWLMPFQQTPLNIIKFGTRHSVLGNIYKDLPALAKGGKDYDRAMANIAMGTLIPMATIMNIPEGHITGHINYNSAKGKLMIEGQIPPYSLKIGDTWYSYERIEPLRSVLGLIANYKEASEQLDPDDLDDQDILNQFMLTIVAPFVDTNLDNFLLPQLSLINRAFDGISGGNVDYAMRQFKRLGASAIIPNLVPQANRLLGIDSTFRLADSFGQILMSRIPGLSDNLEPRLNLWGDPMVAPEGLGPDLVSPIMSRELKNDPLLLDLMRLETPTPKDVKTLNGIKLTLKQRHDISLYRGKGIEGKIPPLHEALDSFRTSEEYKLLPDFARQKQYRAIMASYGRAAKDYVIATDPALQQQIKDQNSILQEEFDKARSSN